jgi:paraquat-inducible protein B
MNDLPPPPPLPPEVAKLPVAQTKTRHVSLVWVIPVVAAVIAVFLAWRTLSDRGPLIAITFTTAEGLTPGQTKVEHRAVAVGTVESIALNQAMTGVTVRVRMRREAEDRLTDHARFWVVRPRLSVRSLSGLDTLVSGAYLEMDPGAPGGEPKYAFNGLEEPPSVRSDEPGTSYVLRADRIGSLGPGSPVFYRDVQVGEVLSYDLHSGIGPVTVNVFVHAPFDRLVRPRSEFWNASGLSVTLGAGGFHVEVESLQALLSGGVAFDTPSAGDERPPSPPNSTFVLYGDKGAADSARFRTKVPLVAYFHSSANGLAAGAPVAVYGIQVGVVTGVSLLQTDLTSPPLVRVEMQVEPDRIGGVHDHPDPATEPQAALAVVRGLVAQGMRAQLTSANFLTGQQLVTLAFLPDAPPAEATMEADHVIVLPTQDGGLADITTSVANFTTKLNQLPLTEIGHNLNDLLVALNGTVGGPAVRQTLQELSSTLASVQTLVRQTDAGLAPTLDRLPKIADELQQAVARANRVLGAVDAGYGTNSEFQSSVNRVLGELTDTARSIRVLADFLDRHPEALIRGRAGADR